MVITLDLPDDLVEAIDKKIAKRPEEPVWPFEKRALKYSKLSYKDREKLEKFQKAMKAYTDFPMLVKPERGSRSAIVEDLLRLQLKMPIVITDAPKASKKRPEIAPPVELTISKPEPEKTA